MPFLLCYPKFIPQKQQAGLTTHKSRQDRSGHTQKIPNNFFLLLLAIALSLSCISGTTGCFFGQSIFNIFCSKGFYVKSNTFAEELARS